VSEEQVYVDVQILDLSDGKSRVAIDGKLHEEVFETRGEAWAFTRGMRVILPKNAILNHVS